MVNESKLLNVDLSRLICYIVVLRGLNVNCELKITLGLNTEQNRQDLRSIDPVLYQDLKALSH